MLKRNEIMLQLVNSKKRKKLDFITVVDIGKFMSAVY